MRSSASCTLFLRIIAAFLRRFAFFRLQFRFRGCQTRRSGEAAMLGYRWIRKFMSSASISPFGTAVSPLARPERPVAHERVREDRPPRRAIVIDSETTGLSPASGERMVSFGAIELIDGRPTGSYMHLLFNPGRKSHFAARRVHGLCDQMLARQPHFSEHAAGLAEFLGNDPLIGHNVAFDIRFLAAEFENVGRRAPAGAPVCTMGEYKVRRKAGRASLDTACASFGIDASARAVHHGALIDADLASILYQRLVLGFVEGLALGFRPPQNYREA
jgi:DNA polymerase III subunit epsilon